MSSHGWIAGLLFSAVPVLAQEMPADYKGVLQTLGKQGDYWATGFKAALSELGAHSASRMAH